MIASAAHTENIYVPCELYRESNITYEYVSKVVKLHCAHSTGSTYIQSVRYSRWTPDILSISDSRHLFLQCLHLTCSYNLSAPKSKINDLATFFATLAARVFHIRCQDLLLQIAQCSYCQKLYFLISFNKIWHIHSRSFLYHSLI